MKKLLAVALIFASYSSSSYTFSQFKGEECILKSEYIYSKEDVPFPSCHASSICEINNGLLSAWFGGTDERNPDVGIWVSRYQEGKWSKPVEVANGIQHKSKRYPCWNPVLFNNNGEILLFFKVGPSPSTWWGELTVSKDNGKTWSIPRRLPEDIYGPIKNKPVKLSDGTLISPSSTEHDGWRVHMEFSSANLVSWERTEFLNDKTIRLIQPTILIHPRERLQMLCRSGSGKVISSFSEDKGHTWSAMEPLSLPNPNSGIDAVTLKNGSHLLVYNHLTKGRYMLNVAISEDGLKWYPAALLENDIKETEYSYPAIIQTSDGLIHITYTWRRELIKHVVIDPSKIKPGTEIKDTWPE